MRSLHNNLWSVYLAMQRNSLRFFIHFGSCKWVFYWVCVCWQDGGSTDWAPNKWPTLIHSFLVIAPKRELMRKLTKTRSVNLGRWKYFGGRSSLALDAKKDHPMFFEGLFLLEFWLKANKKVVSSSCAKIFLPGKS